MKKISDNLLILKQPIPNKSIQSKLTENRKMVEQYNKQIKQIQSKHQMQKVMKYPLKVVLQRRKQKDQQLKPKDKYFQEQTHNISIKKNFNTLNVHNLSSNIQYWENSSTPPSCVGYSIAYNHIFHKIFLYGGISCNNTLQNGLKNYFYQYQLSKNKWKEILPKSVYIPTTRYNHSLCSYNKELVMFGGVSQFKSKLKDRCQYSQINTYDILKGQWKIFETFSSEVKARKNHAACIYGSYLIVYGGQNNNQDILNQIIWINLESKKPRWKSFTVEGRINHKIIYLPNINGGSKEYLYSFGGFQSNNQLNSDVIIFPINFEENHLIIRQSNTFPTKILPRQLYIFCRFDEGILIMGGLNQQKQQIKDCQYLNVQKFSMKQIKIELNWDLLKNLQGVTISSDQIFIFGGNQQTYILKK